MKKCDGCKYRSITYYFMEPCKMCLATRKKTEWTPNDEIAELIEDAERRAFEAGWEKAIDLYEAGELRGYKGKDYEGYKEETKWNH